MSQTKDGARKAAQTLKERYDEAFKAEGGFYAAIGRRGAKAGWANRRRQDEQRTASQPGLELPI